MDSIEVMIRDLSVVPSGNLVAHYRFDGNANDASGNAFHGVASGVSWVTGINGATPGAAHFDGQNDYIHVANNDILNFEDAISLLFWISIDEFLEHEQYPISHGNWDHRYKVSISDQRYRFTLNTSAGITDLDTETDAVPGEWHHIAAVYDGSDMEIWIDGSLDAFTSASGTMNKTTYDLSFGQYLPGVNDANFFGSLDELCIYDFAFSPEQILDHLENNINGDFSDDHEVPRLKIKVYPNPVRGHFVNVWIRCTPGDNVSMALYDLAGRTVAIKDHIDTSVRGTELQLPAGNLKNGTYILSVTSGESAARELIVIAIK
jgi:hypothetical protein